jgi:uncharacterized membrane protein
LLELIAITFAEETIAAQAAQELERRVDDLGIDPDAIGVIICERDGSFQLLTKRRPGAQEAWSTFWGRLLEVVTDQSPGLDPGFCREVNDHLTPGSSVLFLVATPMQGRSAIDALSQYGGASLSCALSSDGMAELREALDGDAAQT